MKLIKPQEIFRVSNPGYSPCLTIYINKIDELQECISEVRRVAKADMTDTEIEELLAPIIEFSVNKKFKTYSSSLGFFVKKDFTGVTRLPFETKPLAVVARSFHVKPLLKWLQREKPFFLLHLDREKATFFQGSLGEIKPIEKFNYRKPKSIEFAISLLERSVSRIVSRSNQPLILSGEPLLTDLFKSQTRYKMLVNSSIFESSAEPKLKDLHQNCLLILESYISNVEDSLLKKYWKAKARGNVTSSLSEIVSLALNGRVKNLFINESMNIWGKINHQKGTFSYSFEQKDSQDDDLLDDLAEIVMFHKGSVTVLPDSKMPDSKAASAILKDATHVLMVPEDKSTIFPEVLVRQAAISNNKNQIRRTL